MKLKTAEIEDLLKKANRGERYPMNQEAFEMHARRYIKAISERRMICIIESVSPSGMSRVLRFNEFNYIAKEKRGGLMQFGTLFKVLGFERARNSDGYRVHGCGMDMVFATNYNIIHQLHHLGFINKKQCAKLAQMTPHKI